MLSAQLLHATVLGSCEKAGRRDAAPHGCAWSNRKEKQCRGEGRGVIIKRKPPWSPLSTARGLSSAETMATFHTDEIFSFATFRVNQAGQGEMAGTHAMPLLKGGREGRGEWTDRMR